MLEQSLHAAALGLAEKFVQGGRLAARPQVQEERDAARGFPVVVEMSSSLEGRNFRRPVERNRARFFDAKQRLDGPARRLFEQHAVDVEDHAPHFGERVHHGSSARSAARKASLFAGVPMLTRNPIG